MKEIERKFVVQSVPFSLEKYPTYTIRQGYLLVSPDEDEVRVRQKEDLFFLTIKKGVGLERQEIEIEITHQQFENLYAATADHCLGKRRFEIEYKSYLIELDIFTGRLNGLIIAEVEFKTVEESRLFKIPEWFDREVTEDAGFANRNLAKHGLPKYYLNRKEIKL